MNLNLVSIVLLLLANANCEIIFQNGDGTVTGRVTSSGCTNTLFPTHAWVAICHLYWYRILMYDNSGCTGNQILVMLPHGVSPDPGRIGNNSVEPLIFSENNVYWNKISSVRVVPFQTEGYVNLNKP